MSWLTHREKHVLGILLLTLIALGVAIETGITNQTIINEWEVVWLLFYILPLGIYLVTDRERRSRL